MNTDKLNVCLFPMEISWEDKNKNIETVKSIFSLIHPDTDLVILPETFSTGFPSGVTKEKARPLAEKNTGETMDLLKDLARIHNTAIAGSFLAETGGNLYNRAFFIEPSGDDYFADKKHLFTPGGEHKVLSKGDDRLKVRFRGWNISMIVCYDLRFPIWCRNKDNEYDLLIVVANWPVPRIKVWETLLVARALENLSYVCGVNCSGTDLNGNEYDGRSIIVDPIGRDISVRIDEDNLLYGALSMEKLQNFRHKFPVWKDADKFEIIED